MHQFSFNSVTVLRGNIMRAVLWGVEDERHLEREYKPISVNVKLRKKLVKWYESFKDQKERKTVYPVFQDRFSQISNAIHGAIYSYESKLERIWKDQKSGTTWENGEDFNPHTVIVEKNRTLNDGVDRYGLLISGETIKTFRYIGGGVGNAKPNAGQISLQSETFRDRVDFLTAQGNVVKSGVTIPKGTPDNSFKEFGGTDEATDPSTYAWRCRIKNAPFLEHLQGITIPQVNHSTLLVVEQTV
jgi:hypothetical protein